MPECCSYCASVSKVWKGERLSEGHVTACMLELVMLGALQTLKTGREVVDGACFSVCEHLVMKLLTRGQASVCLIFFNPNLESVFKTYQMTSYVLIKKNQGRRLPCDIFEAKVKLTCRNFRKKCNNRSPEGISHDNFACFYILLMSESLALSG